MFDGELKSTRKEIRRMRAYQTFMFSLSSPLVPSSRLYWIIAIINLQVEIHKQDIGRFKGDEKYGDFL